MSSKAAEITALPNKSHLQLGCDKIVFIGNEFLLYIFSYFILLIHLHFQCSVITATPSKVTVAPLFKSTSSVELMVLNVLLKWLERFLSPTAEVRYPVEFLKCPRTIPCRPHRNLTWQVEHSSYTILCVEPYHSDVLRLTTHPDCSWHEGGEVSQF